MTHQEAIDMLAAERYLLDEMNEPERFAFEEHFFSCRDCADDVRSGEQMRQRVRSALATEGRATTATVTRIADRARWRPQIVLPWACAATVTLLLGYESLLVVPELQKATGPQALAPIVLRPAARGAEPTIRVSGDQAFAALAVDVNATPAGRTIAYEIRNDRGSTLASGTAPVPAPGTPLLLMVPARQLAPGTRYSLVLRDPAASTTIGEYRFAAVANQ